MSEGEDPLGAPRLRRGVERGRGVGELEDDVGGGDEDPGGQVRGEVDEARELRLEDRRGDADVGGVQGDLAEGLAQGAVRRGALAVPARVQEEDLLGHPRGVPARGLEREHDVQRRAAAPDAPARGVGDDDVRGPGAPRELAAREEAVERALVRPRLPRVRRREHDEVPKLGSGKGAVGGTAIGGPGEEAAVRAQPRLAAGHERALLRLERAEPHGVRDDAHRREPTTRRRREVGNLATLRAGTFFSGRAEARDPRECPGFSTCARTSGAVQ